ncbi:MAG: GDP-L-fucose synthase [Betaproteobacteria bacterium]|nr:GDP-L-fucose synthase [Betaproteobacteria bacterium]
MIQTAPHQSPIFVAGHRGMVGSAITRKLQALGLGPLLLPARSALDLCDAAAVDAFFAREKPAQVYLAAAKVGGILANDQYPADFIRENLLIQTHVLDAAHRHGAQRVLFLGSSCIYPRLAAQPLLESSLLSGPLEPTNRAYALAKIAGIEMCWSYNRQYAKAAPPATGFLAAMPTNLYGTGDNYHPTQSHVIPGLLRRFHEAKVNGQASVTVWGSGRPRREFMHADDDGEAPLVNIGVGEDVTIAELAQLIASVVGFQGSIDFDASKPDGTPQKLMSIQKLLRYYPVKARSLHQGLVQTYQEFLASGAALRS